MKKWSLILPVLLGAVLSVMILSGCRNDGYYQEQAVISAREFLLEETPTMPLMEQEYIKFNRPFMLVSHINGSNYTTGQMQICICWMTPGNPDVYMVYGTSGLRMIDWNPIRIIRKNFKHPQHIFLKLTGKASYELLQMQFGLLSVASANHIRFTLPGVWKCKFALNSNPESKLSAAELAKAEKRPRYVLAWKIIENGQTFYSVYGGTADNDTLKNFKYYFSGIYSEANFFAGVLDNKPLIEPSGGSAVK